MMKTVAFLKSGFDVERFRKKLLCKKKYKTLLETYFSDLPEIEDQNSPKFWDEKFATETESDLFPMSTDRNRIVGSLIQPNTKVLNIGAGMGYLKELLSFEARISGFKIKRIIALTAFPNWYFVKKIINSIFNLRKPNNYIFILEKK